MSEQSLRAEVSVSAVVTRADGTTEDLGELNVEETALTAAELDEILQNENHPLHGIVQQFITGLTEGTVE